MTYDFDSGVAIPTTVERVGVNIELLKAMQPGESKWWSTDESSKAARFYRVAKKLGIPILIRKVGDKDPRGPGVRMWRAGDEVAVDPIAAAAAQAAQAVAPKRTLPTTGITRRTASIPDSGLLPAIPKAKTAPKGKAKPAPKGKSSPKAKAAPKRKLVPGVPSTPAALKRAGA